MKARFAILMLLLLFSSLYASGAAEAASFRGNSIETIIGRNVVIEIEEENLLDTQSFVTLKLELDDANAGNIFFEKSASSALTDTLLPREKKIYKADFTPLKEGSYTLTLKRNNAAADTLSIKVSPYPDFPESDTTFIIAVLAVSVIFYYVYSKNA